MWLANLTKQWYSNKHVINQIVNHDLCVRCGACEPSCPVDIIRFNDQAYPYITEEDKCIEKCQRCLWVCPGENFDFSAWDDRMFGERPNLRSITGIARRALVGYATEEKIRELGASGGLVSQLLIYMLEKNLIDGAVVLGSSVGKGGWQAEPFVARSVEDIKRAQKSKYTLIPVLQALTEIEKTPGRYAVVALPCHVHAIRNYQAKSRKLAKRISFLIGLYCNVAFEPYVLDDLCEFSGVERSTVVDFGFRHGTWPGGIVAQFADGTSQKVLKLEEMRDEFNTLKLFYTPSRCNTCIDFSAEYADIAVGDPWLKGKDGNLLFTDNRTTILTRTELGEEIIHKAEADGYIKTEEIGLQTYMVNFESSSRYKRSFVPKYMLLRKIFGFAVPKYNRDVGLGKMKDFPMVTIKVVILLFAKFKWFRRMGMRLAQTRLSLKLYAWNRQRKIDKFRQAYAKNLKFAEKLTTRQPHQ